MLRSYTASFTALFLVFTLAKTLRGDQCATLPPATMQNFQPVLQAFLRHNCYKAGNTIRESGYQRSSSQRSGLLFTRYLELADEGDKAG